MLRTAAVALLMACVFLLHVRSSENAALKPTIKSEINKLCDNYIESAAVQGASVALQAQREEIWSRCNFYTAMGRYRDGTQQTDIQLLYNFIQICKDYGGYDVPLPASCEEACPNNSCSGFKIIRDSYIQLPDCSTRS